MATIRKRGGKFQAIVRRGYHSQAKTFSKRADAEHWAKRLEIVFVNSRFRVCHIPSYSNLCLRIRWLDNDLQ
jgi:hypothetical protein